MARWTRERVIREILSREAAGQKLTVSIRGGVEPKLYQAGARFFGSWRNALNAAGISLEQASLRARWPRERILARIVELSKHEPPLIPSHLRDKHGGLVRAAEVQFGTWPKAVAAAGVGRMKLRRGSRWSRDGVIQAILARALNNQPLGSRTVRPRSLAEAGARLFGSWRAALAAAGVPPRIAAQSGLPAVAASERSAAETSTPPLRPGQIWTLERVIEAMLARVDDHKAMNAVAVEAEDRSLHRAAVKRFGNWRKALIGAGLNPDAFEKGKPPAPGAG